MSGSSGYGVDVDMRVSSKRGFVDDESAPSWVSALMERMDQRLDANERRIELRMDERLDTNERRIEQVLGQCLARLDRHDVEISAQRRLLEDLRSEIGDFRKRDAEPGRQSSELSSETFFCGFNEFLRTRRMVSENRVGPWVGPFWVSGSAEN